MTQVPTARSYVVVAFISAAVAVLVALPSVTNGFVYDDVWIIERHDVVHSLDSFGTLLTAPYWPGGVIWRPVALVGYAMQWALSDGNPLVFHVSNILLYGIVSGLVALLGTGLFGVTVGLIAGVLFAVHPVHVEVTANAIGQAELLAAVGFLIALLIALRRCSTDGAAPRAGLLVAALVAVACGLGAKEHVVTVPGALLVVWWIASRKGDRSLAGIVGREWPVLAGFVALIGIYLVFRAQFAVSVTNAGGVAAVFEQRSALGRAIVMLPVSLRWLILLFAPIHLSADYSVQHLVPQPNFGAVHGAVAAVWAALALLVWRNRNVPGVLGGSGLFVVTISVVSSIFVPLEILFAERFLFLPSVGWSFAVAGAVCALAGRGSARLRQTVWAAAGVGAMLFAVKSAQRATVWRSNDVFFTQLVRDAPSSYRGHWALGAYAFQRGDSALGEQELKTAIGLNPDRADLLEQLGRIYAAAERYGPAIPLLARAVELDSSLLQSSLALAVALARTGWGQEALEVLDTAAEIHGEGPGLLAVQGEVFKRLGQPQAALDVFNRMSEQEPGLWRIHAMAAEAAALSSRCDEAHRHLEAALAAAPASGREEIEALRTWVANGNAPCK